MTTLLLDYTYLSRNMCDGSATSKYATTVETCYLVLVKPAR